MLAQKIITFGMTLAMTLQIAPVFALRAQPDRAGLESQLEKSSPAAVPAAGLEELDRAAQRYFDAIDYFYDLDHPNRKLGEARHQELAARQLRMTMLALARAIAEFEFHSAPQAAVVKAESEDQGQAAEPQPRMTGVERIAELWNRYQPREGSSMNKWFAWSRTMTALENAIQHVRSEVLIEAAVFQLFSQGTLELPVSQGGFSNSRVAEVGRYRLEVEWGRDKPDSSRKDSGFGYVAVSLISAEPELPLTEEDKAQIERYAFEVGYEQGRLAGPEMLSRHGHDQLTMQHTFRKIDVPYWSKKMFLRVVSASVPQAEWATFSDFAWQTQLQKGLPAGFEVQQVMWMRSHESSEEPIQRTVHIYVDGDDDVVQAVRIKVEQENVAGVNFQVQQMRPGILVFGPGLILRQEDAPAQKVERSLIQVNLPGDSEDAVRQIDRLKPAALAALAFDHSAPDRTGRELMNFLKQNIPVLLFRDVIDGHWIHVFAFA
ncbi:MAG: hypothetical protein HY594_00425 [Candidatus Omnitrophica bacterium]|nr:hypothetical protein [Candidatus Omnitrophota bacterium]